MGGRNTLLEIYLFTTSNLWRYQNTVVISLSFTTEIFSVVKIYLAPTDIKYHCRLLETSVVNNLIGLGLPEREYWCLFVGNFPPKIEKAPKNFNEFIFNLASFSLCLSLLNLRIVNLSLSLSPQQNRDPEWCPECPASESICSCNSLSLLDLLLQFSVTHLTIAICSFLSLLPNLVSSTLCPRNATLSHSHCLSFTKNALKLKASVHGSIGRSYCLSGVQGNVKFRV